MFIETVRSPGLAHLSYILGDAGRAAVIDPRRDYHAYLEIAARDGCRITHIIETHRNEDYVVGSTGLAEATGAEVYHGAQTPFAYGNGLSGGEEFALGALRLKVLHTPGHSIDSISLALYDTAYSRQEAVAVFTGDTLFVGEVGRTDFVPGREEEMADLLYESIHGKLLPLGDGVMVLPGHGQGSICGGDIASREFSTLGYEKKHSPAIAGLDREGFVARKTGERHFMPAYFRRVHSLNQEGPPPLRALPSPLPLEPEGFEELAAKGTVLDVRSKEAFAGTHLPGSLFIPLDKVSAYAAWYLDADKPVCLVVNSAEEVEEAVRRLLRLGIDDIPAFLAGGMLKWEVSGRPYGRMAAVHASELVGMLEARKEFLLLDVRTPREFESGHLPTALNIHMGELPERLREIPKDVRVVTFCGSGERAAIAASVLRMHGYEDVDACFGSMAACSVLGCPIEVG